MAGFRVVLDACLLANFAASDLYLVLAEDRLFYPKWSATILDEVERTHKVKLGWESVRADSWRRSVEEAFPEALVTDFESFIPLVPVHEDDRHVAAVALRSNSDLIVTYNLRHFPATAMVPWKLEARHPGDYLITLYEMHSALVVHHLNEIAAKRRRTLNEQLEDLSKHVPSFTNHLRRDLGMD